MGPTPHHAAPDALPADFFTGDNKCVAHAKDVAEQYAAQVHFLGVIAGIYGVNEQNAAIAKIKAAVADLIKETGSTLSKANDMANDAALGWGGGILDGYLAVGEWFERNMTIGGEERANETARIRAEKLSEAKRAAARERFLRDWATLSGQIIDYAKKTYAEIKQLCLNGQWKIALCKFGIDLAFAILENAIIAGIAALTAGAGAVAARVGMTAIKRGEKFVVSLVRKDRGGQAFEIGNVEKHQLSQAEKRILGEENQGSTRTDAKTGEAEVLDEAAKKKARQREAGKKARADGKEGETTYNNKHNGRSLQNGSDNGLDSIVDDANGLTISEIKTSTRGDYTMYGEELLGGEHFTKSRLASMVEGKTPYGKMSQDDLDYASELQERIKSGEAVTYQKVKLKKNADGNITEDGVEPWPRDEAAYKAWRKKNEEKKKKKAEKRAAKKAEKDKPPSTGPPLP